MPGLKTIFKPGLFQYNIKWNVAICTIFVKEALKMKKYFFFISYRNNYKGSRKKVIKSLFAREEIRDTIGNLIAKEIHHNLSKHMYSHYYNPKDQAAGNIYANRLEQGVRNCKIFVWVLTGDCLHYRRHEDKKKQDWFLAEILWAGKYDKIILPVMDSSYQHMSRKMIASQLRTAFDSLVEYFSNYEESERLFVEGDRDKIEKFIQYLCDYDVDSDKECRLGGGQKIKIESPTKKSYPYKRKKAAIANGRLSKPMKDAIKNAVVGQGGIVKNAKKAEGTRIWRVKLRIIQVILALLIIGGTFGGKKAYDWYKYNSTVWDGSTTLKNGWEEVTGNGTKEHPYKIKTAKQLAWLSTTSQVDNCEGKYFDLESDIILNEYNLTGIRNNTERAQIINWDKNGDNGKYVIDKDATHYWNPIGSEEYPFQGDFNGNNHVIYGLLLSGGDSNYQGLFGFCGEKSKIKNINVVGASVNPYSTGNYVGAITGKSDGIIDRCSCYSSMMVGNDYVGGLVGQANIITNSFSNSWIENDSSKQNDGDGHFGGVVGECNYIINSASSSMLCAEKGYVGGIAGEINKSAYNCVELDMGTDTCDLGWYVTNSKPITFCNIFGNYGISKDNYTNLYYNSSDQISIQIGREMYNTLVSIYPDFFEGYVDSNPNKKTGLATGHFTLSYHDYSVNTGLYNQIGHPIDFFSITNQLNKGVKDVEQNRPDIVELLKVYGDSGNPIELDTWIESDDDKGIFSVGRKNPWLKTVDSVREKWKSNFQKDK